MKVLKTVFTVILTLVVTFTTIYIVARLPIWDSNEKLEAKGRVENGVYTFTSSEFKALYNEANRKKIGDFTEQPVDGYDVYFALAIVGDDIISADVDQQGGKVTQVHFKYKGGHEENGMITYTEGETNTIRKEAGKVFKVCCPDQSIKAFNEFCEKNMDVGMWMDSKVQIGDIEVYMRTGGADIEFIFTPQESGEQSEQSEE